MAAFIVKGKKMIDLKFVKGAEKLFSSGILKDTEKNRDLLDKEGVTENTDVFVTEKPLCYFVNEKTGEKHTSIPQDEQEAEKCSCEETNDESRALLDTVFGFTLTVLCMDGKYLYFE